MELSEQKYRGGYIYGGTVINDDQWHHVAVVLENDGTPDISEAKLYVDGNPETIQASLAKAVDTMNTQKVQIGSYTLNPGVFRRSDR